MSRPATAEEITSLMRDLFSTVEIFGLRYVQQHLEKMIESESDKIQALRKQILDEVSKVYGVPSKELMSSKKRGEVTDAKATAIILIHQHLNLSNAEIGGMFGCGRKIVERKLRAFKRADGSVDVRDGDVTFVKIYSSKTFLSNFRIINDKINDYKAKWKKPK